MKRLTICVDDSTLKACRKIQAECQINEELSVSLSNVIESCCNVAIQHAKEEIKQKIAIRLER